MIKRGFTLVEALLAIAIIGIVAAAITPTVNNLMPDRHKATVLKYYSAISETTAAMLDNDFLYYSGTTQDAGTGLYAPTCVGLDCTGQPLVAPYDDAADAALYTNNVKYPNLLADMLNLTRVQDGEYTYTDGSNWQIALDGQNYNISINFEPLDAGACSYNANNCTNPDVFIFRVNNVGTVTAGDAMTAAYLEDPKRNKREDRRRAAVL